MATDTDSTAQLRQLNRARWESVQKAALRRTAALGGLSEQDREDCAAAAVEAAVVKSQTDPTANLEAYASTSAYHAGLRILSRRKREQRLAASVNPADGAPFVSGVIRQPMPARDPADQGRLARLRTQLVRYVLSLLDDSAQFRTAEVEARTRQLVLNRIVATFPDARVRIGRPGTGGRPPRVLSDAENSELVEKINRRLAKRRRAERLVDRELHSVGFSARETNAVARSLLLEKLRFVRDGNHHLATADGPFRSSPFRAPNRPRGQMRE